MKHYLGKYWFFIGVASVVLAAFCFPALGTVMREWHFLNVAIFVAFLITGLTLETKQIVKEIRNVKAISAALGSCFILFPVLAFLLAKVFFPGDTHDHANMIVGACILGVAPVTIASGTVLTYVARGNVPLSLFICVAASLTAMFTIPFSLKILLQFEQDMQLPVLQMIRSLVFIVLVPTIIGQLLRVKVKDIVTAWRKGFSIFSQIVVLLIIFNAVSKSTPQITQLGLRIVFVFVFVVGLHTIILLANFGIAKLIRLNRASTAAFTIHTSQKTLTVSYIVWDGYFAAAFPLAMIPTIAHHLTMLIMDTAGAQRFRRAQQ